MNKKIIFICSIAVLTLFFGIKLNNFLIGQKILGTSTTAENLKIKPIRRYIKPANNRYCLCFTMAGMKFDIPKTDTVRTFKYKDVFRSFLFRDSSGLKIYKDSIKIDFSKILTSMEPTYNNVIGNYIKNHKIVSSFDLLLLTYNKTPDDISFFNLSKENTIIQYTFLKLKDLSEVTGSEKGIYYFILNNIKAFQYGSPETRKITFVSVFINKGDEYLLNFTGFKQEQIDYVINSIDKFQNSVYSGVKTKDEANR